MTLLSDYGTALTMNEMTPEVNRAFSAVGFFFISRTWGDAPGWQCECAFGATQSLARLPQEI